MIREDLRHNHSLLLENSLLTLFLLLLVLVLQDDLVFGGVEFGLLQDEEVEQTTHPRLLSHLLSLVEVQVVLRDVGHLLQGQSAQGVEVLQPGQEVLVQHLGGLVPGDVLLPLQHVNDHAHRVLDQRPRELQETEFVEVGLAHTGH